MKQIILCIDIQKEYISNGRPYQIKGIQNSLDNAKRIIDVGRQKEVPIWHMRHEHDKNVFTKHSDFADFIDGFHPKTNELHFTKDMYSCFSSVEFSKQLAILKPDEIVVIGYGSSMCCTCTIIDGIHQGYKFTLIEDATASKSFLNETEDEMHRSAINILSQYAKIKNTNEYIAELAS